MTFDKDITKIKSVTFFLRHSVYTYSVIVNVILHRNPMIR